MNSIYVTSDRQFCISDTHFGHDRIREYANRPFTSVEEMDETLIRNWNATVRGCDTVYHLGDFALGKVENWTDLRDRLNGRIVLILGNHDRGASRMLEVGMDEVYKSLTLSTPAGNVYMRHVPDFPNRHCDFHLYGHVHDKTPPNQPPWARNMCVEVNDYRPRLLNEILQEMRGRYALK